MNQFVGLRDGKHEEDFMQLKGLISTSRQCHMCRRDWIEGGAENAYAPVCGDDADPGRGGAIEAQPWGLRGIVRARVSRGHQCSTTLAVPTVTGSPRCVSHQMF